MKFEQFVSGTRQKQYQYDSFLPATINHDWTWEDPRINVLLERATKSLGELNAFTLIVPDVDLFIRMHVLKEASKSSEIEGTKTGMDEAVLPVEDILPERRNDWLEVHNYVDAMNEAIEALKSLPLSLRLLRNAHATLMSGVRGEMKTPGEFRHSQNWIGGSSLADAAFIPPYHAELPALLSDLEKFWHNEEVQVPNLIRCAISHYQFETIHPFLDGNGRIGRLLITLYLVSHGLLAKPSLYLSDHMEKHRGAYYDALTRVRESNDIGQWCRFFLLAVLETAENGKKTFQEILALRQETDRITAGLGRKAESARRLMDYLYNEPMIDVHGAARLLGSKYSAANNLIADLEKAGILKEVTGYRRNRVFLFAVYLDIFQGQK